MLVNTPFNSLNAAIAEFSKLKSEGFNPITQTEKVPEIYKVGDKIKCVVNVPLEARILADEKLNKEGKISKWLIFLVRVKDDKGNTFSVSTLAPDALQVQLAANPNAVFEAVVGSYPKDGVVVKTAQLILAPVAQTVPPVNANPFGG